MKKPDSTAWQWALAYGLAAAFWMAATQALLTVFVKDRTTFLILSASRDLALILATAGLVFVIKGGSSPRRKPGAEPEWRDGGLNAFLNAAPLGVVLLDRNLRCRRINQLAARMNAALTGGYVGKTIQEIFPEFAPGLEPLLKEVLATGGSRINIELEGDIRGQPAMSRHWLHSCFPIRTVRGETGGVGIVFVEITELKRATEKLRESELRFRQVVESIQEVFWMKDLATGQILYVSSGYELIWGRTGKSVCASPNSWMEAIHAEDRERVRTAIGVNQANGTYNEEYRIVRPDGSVRWIRDRAFPVTDGDGIVYRIAGVAEDITRRKLAEDELRWKNAFLEAQEDSTLDGVLVVDCQGKKILQNRRVNELWKLPPHIIENQDDGEQLRYVLKQTKNPEEFLSKVTFLYSQPDMVSNDEIELIDGTILERYTSPVRDGSGKNYGRIWIFHDITGRRQLEAKYRHAQKMEVMGQMAAGVAHDFNNFLAVIQLQADVLKLRVGDLERQQRAIKEIEKTAQRAATLNRQLLVFSRREAVQQRDLNLNECMASIGKMLESLVGTGVELRLVPRPEPLWIHADAGMIDQILLNLTVNARDAMPHGGQLIIATTLAVFDNTTPIPVNGRPGSFARIGVTDTGSGIPPEILPNIFEPFFTTKEMGKGTGLGLATVCEIAGQHHGWVTVTTEVGRGTTFDVYFPSLPA